MQYMHSFKLTVLHLGPSGADAVLLFHLPEIEIYSLIFPLSVFGSVQRIKKLTTPSPDLKMRGKLAATSPYAANDAKVKADGKISTISEKETHF